MKYLLANQGVFRTIQGEGFLVGTPMIFVRLGGCSIGCQECDTDYKVTQKMYVLDFLKKIINISSGNDWIWLTGGEPTDQNLDELVEWLRRFNYKIAIATSGTRKIDITKFDWISVSPHSKDFVQRSGNEIKCIPGLNGLTFEDIKSIDTKMFEHKFIQPLSQSNYQECIDFVLKNSDWKLGLQNHKYWNIP